MKRKPLQQDEITLGGKTYEIEGCVEYGGTSLIYKIIDKLDGHCYILKECYPSKLQDSIIRQDDGSLSIHRQNILSEENEEALFEQFKKLFLSEYTIYDTKLKYYESSDHKNRTVKSNNPEAIKCYGSFHVNNTEYIILDETKSNTLQKIIESRWNGNLSSKDIKEIARTMLEVVNRTDSLHKNKHLLHLDICPSNIVIENETNTLRLIDFNSAFDLKPEDDTKGSIRAYSSRKGYSAIEVEALSRNSTNLSYLKNITEKSDSYSIGCILFRIFVGRTIETKDRFSPVQWQHEVKNRLKKTDIEVQDKIISIISKAISSNPKNRYDLDTFREEMLSVEEAVYNAPFRKMIETISDTLSNTAARLKITKKKLVISIITTILICVSGLGCYMYWPNLMTKRAYAFIKDGNAKSAYEELTEIHDIYRSVPHWFHPFYSEETLKSLAWAIYQERDTETTVTFEDNVIQAVKTEDNQIVALLEDGKIVSKNLTVNSAPNQISFVPNIDGVLSFDGRYYVSINDKTLEAYDIDCGEIIYKKKNAKNFALDGNYLLVYCDNEGLEAVSLNTLETLSCSGITLESVPKAYVPGMYTMDYKMEQNKFCFVDQDENIVIKDLDADKTYVYTPKLPSNFVQLNKNSTFTTIQVSDLKNHEYEYNYVTAQEAIALTTQEYSYHISPQKNIDEFFQKMIDKSSGVDRYIAVQENKVMVKLVSTEPSSKVRFLKNTGNIENDFRALSEIGSIDNNSFYYDFDQQRKLFYRTNIHNGDELILSFNSDADLNEIFEFVVNGDTLCIAKNDMILFCEIHNNSIDEVERVNLTASKPPLYIFSQDKKMFACAEDNDVKIYKYDSTDGWSLYDSISIDINDTVALMRFSNDNSKLCIEYSYEKEKLYRLAFYKDTERKYVEYQSEGFGEYPINAISDIMRYAYSFATNKNDTSDHIKIMKIDCEKKKCETYQIKKSIRNLQAYQTIAIGQNLITSISESSNSDAPPFSLFKNDEQITRDTFSVSNPVQISENEIAYVERAGSQDSLIKFNLSKNKKKTIPLHTHMSSFPYIYELYSLPKGEIIISELHETNIGGICSYSYIHQDFSLNDLLKECEKIYR